jgi:hypothetical protein
MMPLRLSLALRLWDQVELWRGGAESERVGGDGWPRRLRHELDFFFLTRGRRELGVPVFSFLFFFLLFPKTWTARSGPVGRDFVPAACVDTGF